MRINKDLKEYCFDLYAGYMAVKNKDKNKRNVYWDIPKKTEAESKK